MSDWAMKTLGEVAKLANKRPIPFEGVVPYIATQDITGFKCNPSEEVTYFNRPSRADILLSKDDVLQAKMRGTNKAFLVGEAMNGWLASTGFAQFKPYILGNSSEYFYHLISSEMFNCEKDRLSGGSTQQAISDKDLNKISMVFPTSISLQNKIAQILSTVSSLIERTEALIEKHQQIKAGLTHDLFTRGIGTDGKLRPSRNQAPDLYYETKIGWVPIGWDVHNLSDLALPNKGSTVIGPFGSDLVLSDYRDEGTPVIFVRDVKENRFNWISNTFVSKEKTQKLFAHKVKSGDILATKMGLPPCVSCTYPDTAPLGIITADMIRLSPDSAKVNTKWLSAAINQERTKRQVAAITAGVTRPKVTLADFRNLKIATPHTSEQQRIINILGKQWDLISAEESKLEKLLKQKAGLMNDLLTGKKTLTLSDCGTDHV